MTRILLYGASAEEESFWTLVTCVPAHALRASAVQARMNFFVTVSISTKRRKGRAWSHIGHRHETDQHEYSGEFCSGHPPLVAPGKPRIHPALSRHSRAGVLLQDVRTSCRS